MPIIEISTIIAAPIERCFDLARSVDFHLASTPGTNERAAGGIRAGLVGLGDRVTWEARHLGCNHRLTSEIVEYDRPSHFRDRQVAGPFRMFEHDHSLGPGLRPGQTKMTDRVSYRAPLGLLGAIAERLWLTRYLTRFLTRRAELLKLAAETDQWARYVTD